MIKNYFITALRTLRRNKLFALINVLGLSVGISAALIIYLLVQYDFSFEQFRKDKDRIYRVVTSMSFSNSPVQNSGLPYPIIAAARKEVRGIEGSTSFFTYSAKASVPREGAAPQVFKSGPQLAFVDEQYFDMFPCQWIAGTPVSMSTPYRVVLSESDARNYFPGFTPAQAVGRTVIYDDSITCTVAGVVKDLDDNTDFVFKQFISLPTFRHTAGGEIMDSDWGSVSSATQFFIRLDKNTTPRQIEQQLASLRKKYSADSKDTVNRVSQLLQPLTDMHFAGPYDNFSGRQASKPALYSLLLVAVFLLALGSINFINLTTAQAAQRAKEIGIRKTLGSSRRRLILQFLSEALLLTVTAALLSLLLVSPLMKLFSDFIPAGLHPRLSHRPDVILFMAALTITVSLLSGFYPAMVLSRFRPVLALKNQAYAGTSATRSAVIRKSLTVFQFVIAQAFIIGTLIVSRQIHYFLNKDMGFKKEAIVFVYTPWNNPHPDQSNRLMMDQLRKIPGITRISLAGFPPAAGGVNSELMTFNDGRQDIHTDLQEKSADTAYMGVYGLRLLAGRNFIPGPDSPRQLIINRTYARILGFNDPRQALGKTLNRNSDVIVGVMEDFHQASLHRTILPLALIPANSFNTHMFHLSLPNTPAGRASWKATIASTEKAFKKVYPGVDFNYQFFDESIEKFYTAEQHMSSLLRWATGLTIFISCLGLLGLVIYATNLRTKEIGIRKVLGASVTQIVSLLSKDFVKLVCIAFVIAPPLAWYGTHRWLENFAYRTTISWWVYALSGLIMFLIALLTLSIQTIRSANANPVSSLRAE